jgi:hypothetical protein
MLVELEEIKQYLGINNSPNLLDFDIDATAGTLTRGSGSWITGGFSVGDELMLAGFDNANNNVIVTVASISQLVLEVESEAALTTETGDSLTSYRIENTEYDDFLTSQEEIISASVEEYCSRTFSLKTYVETFYQDDFSEGTDHIHLNQYPVTDIEYAMDGEDDITEDVRFNKPRGTMKGDFFQTEEEMEVKYTAGFEEIPPPVKSVILSLVGERYSKKSQGVDLNFGSDIQRVSIPGTLSIDYDYSLTSNDRKTGMGIILGNYVNVLDQYRSDRAVSSSRDVYIEEVVEA